MNTFSFIALLLLGMAVLGCRTRNGGLSPVYLTGDATLFNDSLDPVQTVWYSTERGRLDGGNGEQVELRRGKTVAALIQGRTVIGQQNNFALVYPNEIIRISSDTQNDGYSFSSASGNLQRDWELQFLSTFRKLVTCPAVPNLADYTLETVLTLEKTIKAAIPETQARAQHVFDSLLKAHSVSGKFRKLIRNLVYRPYAYSLLWLYKIYYDTLSAHGLYVEKVRQLLPGVNSLKDKEAFNDNARNYLNDLIVELFPTNRVMTMGDEVMLKACFDSVERNFTGLAREYLRSWIIYRANRNGLVGAADYAGKFRKYMRRKTYQRIATAAKKERAQRLSDAATVATRLMAVDGETIFTFDSLMAGFRGKYVFVDFWGSWCVPCLQETPFLKQLERKYGRDAVVFLTFSFDRETAEWRRAMFQRDFQELHNYLLLEGTKTTLAKRYSIQTLPRYLLFDREGKVIHENAPSPRDTALQELLNKLLPGSH